ncbi:hypothetical protein EV426DRAFT_58652 [Tirmania nivea]|nr:hypothetical protein EV426DRAFT_58652 [Tirmania nivea]
MPRPPVVRNDTLDLQNRGAQGGGALGVGQSQAIAMRNVAEEQAQAQLNVNRGLNADLTDMHVNETGTIGVGGTPGDLIRSGREAQAAEAETDDQFDERVSSSPSIDDEDIDFEFVYALHTFVATVEGQANAVKGETMVLLDDSNSYWWLVRIVKDQSIGYLPAEHIETPSERLARLNKHRNVDLSAAMLHDAPVKSQNPIRNALRRRGAKSVAFAPVQYFEYTPPSDDEGSGVEEPEIAVTEEPEEVEQPVEEEDEITVVEPLQTIRSTVFADTAKASLETPAGDNRLQKHSTTSLKDIDTALNNADTIETKKITLTPRVAQDDSSLGATPLAQANKEKRSTSERERVQRIREELVSPPPKGGKGKKGTSVLGGFFKKRSRKGKHADEVDDVLGNLEKNSLEGRDSQDSTERQQAAESRKVEPRRDQAKPILRPEPRQEPKPELKPELKSEPVRKIPIQLQPGGATIRKVEPESPISNKSVNRNLSIDTSHDMVKPSDGGVVVQTVGDIIKYELRSSETYFENTPTGKLSSPSSPNSLAMTGKVNGIRVDKNHDSSKHQSPRENITSPSELSVTSFDRPFSESPDALTPVDDPPPPLMADNGSVDYSSPVETTNETFEAATDVPSAPTVTWSDSSLKTFFEDSNDVRDFLVLVQDRSGINVRNDHPDIVPLFQDANAKLQDLTNRLDGLLGDYLQRRGRS